MSLKPISKKLSDLLNIEVLFNKNEINVADFIKKFEGMKNKIKDISTKETDLEEIFINLLKK